MLTKNNICTYSILGHYARFLVDFKLRCGAVEKCFFFDYHDS